MKKYTDDQLYKIYLKKLDKTFKQLVEKEKRLNERRIKYNENREVKLSLFDKSKKVVALSEKAFLETLEEDKIKRPNKTEVTIARDMAIKQTKLYSIWGKDSSFDIASAIYHPLKEMKESDPEYYKENIANQDIFDKYGNINYFKLASSIASAKIDIIDTYNQYLLINGMKDSHERADEIKSKFFYGSK